MKIETIDIHFGASSLVTKSELEYILEQAQGVLIGGRPYKLIQDEGKDNWEVWGEGRETWSDPWHLVVRVEYPQGLANIYVYEDCLEFETIFGDWLRELHHEDQKLIAVITDSVDWSVYRGGPVRTIPV